MLPERSPCGPMKSLDPPGLIAAGAEEPTIPDTPWDCHICRSVGVVRGVNGAAFMAVPWRVWEASCQAVEINFDAERNQISHETS